MIITRTPLRISLGGGGTDLRSCYERHGGFVVAAAITKYVYVGINTTFTGDYSIKYSELERTKRVEDIEHPIIRAAFELHDVQPSIEIVSLADIPSGTGLGSSGAFTVGLLRAIYAHRREAVSATTLAEEACHIEIECLGRSVGKQDPYVAAFGGLVCLEFGTDGALSVSPLMIPDETLHELEDHLLMFFTGYERDADLMLEDQRRGFERGDLAMIDNLREIQRIGYEVRDVLEAGDTGRFGELMHEHWQLKQRRTPGMSNPVIDGWYELALQNGATGGKLVGAGAGGFLLLYAPDPPVLRHAMTDAGLDEVRFSFDHDGSIVHLRDA